jgi:hypothetical protein
VIHRSRPAAASSALLLVIFLLAACGGITPSPDVSTAPSTRPSETIETVSPVTPGPLLEGQTETDTDIGRIWDTLPHGFPMYPGAARSDEAQDGPSSGVYVVEGDPETIARWFHDQLRMAAFGTPLPSGPLEDGSFEVYAVGQDPACRLRVVIAPLGSLTALTMLYGAGCPHA